METGKKMTLSLVAVMLAVFVIVFMGCPEPGGGDKNQINAETFTSIEAMGKWLSAQPANTPATVYTIKLNVSELGDFPNYVGTVLRANDTKYIYLDLSGSTITTIPSFPAYGPCFAGCATLTGIIIPNSVTTIEMMSRRFGVFDGCTNLTTINVDSGNSAYSSIEGVLYNKNKSELITYPAGKTGSAFTMPDSVTIIGRGAFYDCTSLASVTIPDSITNIGSYAFYRCNSLVAINVDSGNSAYSSIEGVLYNKNKSELITYPAGKTGSAFTIPDSVTIIGNGAFDGCTSLAGVTIPNSVTNIGSYAFYGCTSLAGVTIPDSVTIIDSAAFYGCTSLASVTFQGTISFGYFSASNVFSGDLWGKFYAEDPTNGTPGTYTTTAPVSSSSVWTKQ